MPIASLIGPVARSIATKIASQIGFSGQQIREWILATAAWNDAGYWKDSATWIDS